jgi:hypothetical protein
MTSKDAAPKQPASQEQPGSNSLPANKPGGEVCAEPKGPILEVEEHVNPDLSAVISDEILRHRVRTLLGEKPKPSSLQSFLTHPLVITAVGFLLTGIVGGLLTYYYTLKQKDLDYQRAIQQQELASQRSFSDELNKIRIQKIGGVWEQLDKNEVLLDALLEKANKASDSDEQKSQNVDAINNLIQEDRITVNENRYWLGEQNYNRLRDYLDKNARIVLNMLLARRGTDLSEIIEERRRAKQDILQIREGMRSEEQPGK